MENKKIVCPKFMSGIRFSVLQGIIQTKTKKKKRQAEKKPNSVFSFELQIDRDILWGEKKK